MCSAGCRRQRPATSRTSCRRAGCRLRPTPAESPPPTPESRPPVALRHQAEDVARLPVTILQPGEYICFRPASLASLPEDLRLLVHCRVARSTRLTFREQERLIRRTGRRPV